MPPTTPGYYTIKTRPCGPVIKVEFFKNKDGLMGAYFPQSDVFLPARDFKDEFIIERCER